ncbi:hypothetical protein ACFX13_008856 [Malus domestica]
MRDTSLKPHIVTFSECHVQTSNQWHMQMQLTSSDSFSDFSLSDDNFPVEYNFVSRRLLPEKISVLPPWQPL